MACKFYITNRDGFYEMNGRMNTIFGYPNLDGSTLTYTEPLVHQDGRYALTVEDRCLPYLTQQEVAELVDQSVLISDGWYPGDKV
jgi:hypothetical protein